MLISSYDGLTMKPGKLQDTCKKEVGPGEFSGSPASSCPKPEGKLSLAAVLLFSVLLLYLAIVVKHSLSPQMTTVPDCGETTTQEISSHPIHGQGSLKITYCKGTPLLMEWGCRIDLPVQWPTKRWSRAWCTALFDRPFAWAWQRLLSQASE